MLIRNTKLNITKTKFCLTSINIIDVNVNRFNVGGRMKIMTKTMYVIDYVVFTSIYHHADDV